MDNVFTIDDFRKEQITMNGSKLISERKTENGYLIF